MAGDDAEASQVDVGVFESLGDFGQGARLVDYLYHDGVLGDGVEAGVAQRAERFIVLAHRQGHDAGVLDLLGPALWWSLP